MSNTSASSVAYISSPSRRSSLLRHSAASSGRNPTPVNAAKSSTVRRLSLRAGPPLPIPSLIAAMRSPSNSRTQQLSPVSLFPAFGLTAQPNEMRYFCPLPYTPPKASFFMQFATPASWRLTNPSAAACSPLPFGSNSLAICPSTSASEFSLYVTADSRCSYLPSRYPGRFASSFSKKSSGTARNAAAAISVSAMFSFPAPGIKTTKTIEAAVKPPPIPHFPKTRRQQQSSVQLQSTATKTRSPPQPITRPTAAAAAHETAAIPFE